MKLEKIKGKKNGIREEDENNATILRV